MTSPRGKKRSLRVLIVDDSALNRRAIRKAFEGPDDIEVVGEASDGDEALRMATEREPDAITLDLEMPRMDGFTFLRILMSKRPTPVIVVSSHSQKENVFRALELGAIDFVEKPDRGLEAQWAAAQALILEKVRLARSLRTPRRPPPAPPIFGPEPPTTRGLGSRPQGRNAPKFVVAIAASTGGPAALLEIFSRLPSRLSAAILVAQHMPERFTAAFAERLAKRCSIPVSEARDFDEAVARSAFVCPGGRCLELEGTLGVELRVRVVAPRPEDTYVPSADRLFESVAKVAGPRAVGVVLTGMGNDGVRGATAIQKARGLVVVESKDTAVIHGMPGAVVRAGVAGRVLPLQAIGELLATLA